MKLWFSIIIALLVQELVMTNTVLLNAYQRGYSVLIISIIFVLATVIDIIVGYALGKFVQSKLSSKKFVTSITIHAERFQNMLGPRGNKLILITLGFVNLNYVNAFLASWTTLSFKEILLYLFLGDILWYATAWIMILGVSTYIDPFYAIYAVLGLSLAFLILTTFVHHKMLHDKLA